MNPAHGLRPLIALLLMALVPALGARGQSFEPLPAALPSGPTYPMIFDDFSYRTPAGYSTASHAGPDGSIFGTSPWLTGPASGGPLTTRGERAWHPNLWLGNGQWNAGWYAGPEGPDFKGFTVSTTALPGRLLFRAHAGTLQDFPPHLPQVRSAFSARTGTWLARVRLPSFDGLAYQTDVADEGALIHMIPAFWARGFDGRDTRSGYTVGGSLWAWPEWNFEVNNWAHRSWPAHPPGWGHPPHVSWDDPHGCNTGGATRQTPASRFLMGSINTAATWNTLGLYGLPTRLWQYSCNPVLTHDEAEANAPGQCLWTGDPVNGRAATARRPGRYCFDVLTGRELTDRTTGGRRPTYAYLMARVSGDETQFFVLVRDESEDGVPGDHVEGFSTLSMATAPSTNFAVPQPMQSLFTLGFHCMRGAPSCHLPSQRDMEVDWFLYTPATDRDVRGLVEDVAHVRAYLDRPTHPAPPPRRINTVATWSVQGPDPLTIAYRGLQPGEDPGPSCNVTGAPGGPTYAVANEPFKPTRPFDFEVEVARPPDAGRPAYFTAVLREGGPTNARLRHGNWHVRWEMTPCARGASPHCDPADTVVSRDSGFVRVLAVPTGADLVRIRTTLTQALPGLHDGRYHPVVAADHCYGYGAGAMKEVSRQYTYDPATGTLTEVEAPPGGDGG